MTTDNVRPNSTFLAKIKDNQELRQLLDSQREEYLLRLAEWPETSSAEDVKRTVENCKGSGFCRGIYLKAKASQTKSLIGIIGITKDEGIVMGEYWKSYNLYYLLDGCYQGKGIMTHNLKKYLRLAYFRYFSAETFEAIVRKKNLQSLRLLERIGFRQVRSVGDHITLALEKDFSVFFPRPSLFFCLCCN